MNKPVYLGLSVLEASKIVIYEFWHDYIKQKYEEKGKLHYIHTDGFIVYIKTEDVYVDISKDVGTKFNTSYYELDRPLPNGKNHKVIRLMKDELSRKIMTEFTALRPKTYSYQIDDSDENKNAKGTKKCRIENLNLKVIKTV